ncbi:hypothetical protein BBK14_25875 [Parafrankia soli]|uniref:SnoaL-like domain-containing protein n=1 Tax=Parafrankia soli TaxID=2599596 RepID=A0A1S1PH55_9ACTN|nr:nuclear transport factor 2 family protein [Parafrankia soli]OHV22203.1 hypothetical protein BBK14_25875 [Parafrankia soli]
MDLQTLSDKIEINEVLTRYARSCDSKDWDLFRTLFTPDAFLDYSSVTSAVGSRDEVAAWLEAGLGKVPWTQHFISNVEIDLDGDRAKVRAMFYNPMLLPGMTELSYCGGYYHHDMVRTPQGWKSERLVEENLWFVNHPGAPTP